MENRIKEVVKEKGKRLDYIADRVGISNTELSNYIANRRKPTNERLLKLANTLNVKVRDLYPNAKRVTRWIIWNL